MKFFSPIYPYLPQLLQFLAEQVEQLLTFDEEFLPVFPLPMLNLEISLSKSELPHLSHLISSLSWALINRTNSSPH